MTTAVITGASRGIGRATAIHLSQNAQVTNIVLIASSYERLLETMSMMDSRVNIDIIVFDLMRLDEIDTLMCNIYEKYGSIDWLLNIAGYTDPQTLLDTTIENIQQTYTINVFATLLLSKAASRYMKLNEESQIVNIASTAGFTPRPGWSAYASSKAAVINLSETLAEELSEFNIDVYCISPGRTATDLRKKLAPEEDPATIMQPEDVAQVIYNLLTDNKSSLAGQNIIVRSKVRR